MFWFVYFPGLWLGLPSDTICSLSRLHQERSVRLQTTHPFESVAELFLTQQFLRCWAFRRGLQCLRLRVKSPLLTQTRRRLKSLKLIARNPTTAAPRLLVQLKAKNQLLKMDRFVDF